MNRQRQSSEPAFPATKFPPCHALQGKSGSTGDGGGGTEIVVDDFFTRP